MWSDSWYEVGRVVLTGVLTYGYLVGALRISGKRTLAKLNAFDLVVTVALGSVLATVIVSRDVSWLEAAAALGVLILAQYVVAWTSSRWPHARTAVQARPAVLLRNGQMDDRAARTNRMTAVDISQAIRSAGYGSLDLVAAVVLETDGSLSVIPSEQLGSGDLVDEPR